jgi:archaetidylinositol phosphate synthase
MHPWRLRLERLFGPRARRIPVSPNTITSIALAMNLGAAVVLALASRDARLFLVTPVLVGVAGLLDAVDGLVARFQGKESRFGDFLDHLSDRVSDSTLIAGWAVGAEINLPLAVASVLLVTLAGYAGTQVEATFHVRSYEDLGRGEFVLSLFTLPLIAFTLDRAGLKTTPWAGMTILEWLTALLAVFALLSIVQRVRRAATIERGTGRSDG